MIQMFNFPQFYWLHQVCFAHEEQLVLVRFKNQVLFMSKINVEDKHKSRFNWVNLRLNVLYINPSFCFDFLIPWLVEGC